MEIEGKKIGSGQYAAAKQAESIIDFTWGIQKGDGGRFVGGNSISRMRRSLAFLFVQNHARDLGRFFPLDFLFQRINRIFDSFFRFIK